MTIDVSVVIPCLNARVHISRALGSVFRSLPDQNLEIIVADGGSTDGTLQYLESQDVYLLEGPDRSLYDGLNKALSQASGEFIIWLNADDELLPGMSELIMTASERGCDMVTGEAETIHNRNLIFRTYHSAREMTTQSLLFGVPTINSRVFRTSLFRRTGLFDWGVGLAADRLMLLELLEKASSRSFFAEPVYRYHSHEGSSTMGNTWASYERVHQANLALAKKLLVAKPDKQALEEIGKFEAVSKMGILRSTIMQGKVDYPKEALQFVTKGRTSLSYLINGIRAQFKLRGTSSGW